MPTSVFAVVLCKCNLAVGLLVPIPTSPVFPILILSLGKALPLDVPNVNTVFPPAVCVFSIYEAWEASLANHILTLPLSVPTLPPRNVIFAVPWAIFGAFT